jgi:hypothetical protein
MQGRGALVDQFQMPRQLAERFRTMLPVQILPMPGASVHYQQHLI